MSAPATAPLTRRWQSLDARLVRAGPIHVRHDLPDGSKDVIWRTGQVLGLGGHRLADLIYAERIPLPARVVITEGERACDAVRGAGLAAVATVCGAGAVNVWSEAVVALFAGVRVTIWPDADAVGHDHMGRIARLLEPVVAAMRLVDVPRETPPGWDAADTSADRIRELVRDAHDVWLAR